MINNKFSGFSQSGQATVELMIILPLLLILLAVSISIFSQQMLIVDSLRYKNGVERSAELVSEALSRMHSMPRGSTAVFYIPKSPETQTISFANGLLEVKGSQHYSSVLLPFTIGETFSMNDGNSFRISIDENNTLSVEVIP
jgi:hypothetical protein